MLQPVKASGIKVTDQRCNRHATHIVCFFSFCTWCVMLLGYGIATPPPPPVIWLFSMFGGQGQCKEARPFHVVEVLRNRVVRWNVRWNGTATNSVSTGACPKFITIK